MKKETLILCGSEIGTYEQVNGDFMGVQYSGVTLNDDIFSELRNIEENEDLTINADYETGEVYTLYPRILLWNMRLR